ncbi:serine/arginine repetitive matrix protein 1 isoform X2 [Hyalella azteca]|uniref:Serine/arginine repetitive matrix protein 1 isoform X2 n=1 Tax=Hyalella azteca TaxID=294128 RepID=A0A8B7NK32_HYAAZ|nr:serine/arginine repetitive matrix protein 1 isoform X2 [Hyalella azteca]
MARSPVHHRLHPRSPPPGHHHPPPRGSSPPPYARPPPPHRRLSVSPSRRRPAVRAPGDDVRRRISPPAKDGRRAILPPPNAQTRRPGPSQPRLSDTNRMPVASMRMRMDDYAPPKPRRNDQAAAIPPLMEQVVVKARREASTRTKDTFWTKKLLDAEDQYSKRGDRWAHSGFKELYRDELGYEPEPPARPSPPAEGQKRGDSRQRDRPVPRDPRAQPRDPRRASPRPRDPRAKPHDPRQSPDRPRDPRTAPRPPRDPRRPGEAVPSPRRATRSPRGRKKSPHRRHRRHRSYSGSYSSGSSSSSSTSYSRSRSYYSRSSYSSTGSSSFSSSSSSRSRSRRPSQGKRKRSHSGSYSSSASPPRIRPPVGEPVKKGRALPANVSEGVKKASALQETTKKVVTKTVSNVVTTKTKILASVPGHSKSSHRGKAKMRIKTDEGDSRKKPSYPQPEPGMEGAVVPTAYYGAPEAGEVAARNSNGGTAAGSSLISSPTNIAPSSSGVAAGPLPHHHHHHHHLPNPKKGGPHMADFSTSGNSGPNQPASPVDDSDSSSSSEEEELPRKMTLSERFGKLAQLSSQRQEYDGVRMKIVREGGQDKKVYLEAGLGSRSPSPLHPGHERWLAEHQTEYAEYQRRYGDIRSWDPHRDLPRDLPPNWEDVGVRYRYYKQSGYFGDRHITLEDYLKWEDWWYQYRDWLKKYGDAAAVDGVARHGKMSDLDWDAYDRPRGGRWPADTRDPGIPERKRRRF